MSEFKAGDQVHLKSGGPTMTVARIIADVKLKDSDEGSVECVWYAKDAYASRQFAKETLKAT